MKIISRTVPRQWMLSLFISFMLAVLMWAVEITPVIEQLNIVEQNNHHLSQKLKSLRKSGNGEFWSAPQLYRWLNLNQKRFEVHIISVSGGRDGIQLVLEGSLQKISFVLNQLSGSRLKSLLWQRHPGQIELLLSAVTLQENNETQDQMIGEVGARNQRYCVYQSGGQIRMMQKGQQC